MAIHGKYLASNHPSSSSNSMIIGRTIGWITAQISNGTKFKAIYEVLGASKKSNRICGTPHLRPFRSSIDSSIVTCVGGGDHKKLSFSNRIIMATESVELLALQRIDETCIQLQQQVRYPFIVANFVVEKLMSRWYVLPGDCGYVESNDRTRSSRHLLPSGYYETRCLGEETSGKNIRRFNLMTAMPPALNKCCRIICVYLSVLYVHQSVLYFIFLL